MIDSDDPGPRFDENGNMMSTGVWREKPGRPDQVDGFDLAEIHDQDVHITFAGTTVSGDLFNGWYNGTGPNRMGGETGIADEPEPSGKNLVVDLRSGAHLTGAVTSAYSRHLQPEIGAADWALLGEVTNVPEPAINNGAIVVVGEGATWQAAGTSYLTRLTVEPGGTLVGTLTIDGLETEPTPGTYTGAVVVVA
jgi:hypothetical protein